MESFSRTATGGAFVVSEFRNVPLNEAFPPNQITDLEATYEDGNITLTWTAPGENLDTGTGKNEMSGGLLM